MESVAVAGTIHAPLSNASKHIKHQSTPPFSFSSDTSRKRRASSSPPRVLQESSATPIRVSAQNFEMADRSINNNISLWGKVLAGVMYIFGGNDDQADQAQNLPPTAPPSVSDEDGRHDEKVDVDLEKISAKKDRLEDDQQIAEVSLSAKTQTEPVLSNHVTEKVPLPVSSQSNIGCSVQNGFNKKEAKSSLSATTQLPSPQPSEAETHPEEEDSLPTPPPQPLRGLFQNAQGTEIKTSHLVVQQKTGKPFYPKSSTSQPNEQRLKYLIRARDKYENVKSPRLFSKRTSQSPYKRSRLTPHKPSTLGFTTPASAKMGNLFSRQPPTSRRQWIDRPSPLTQRTPARISKPTPQKSTANKQKYKRSDKPNNWFKTDDDKKVDAFFLHSLVAQLGPEPGRLQAYDVVEAGRKLRDEKIQEQREQGRGGKVKPLSEDLVQEFQALRNRIRQEARSRSRCYISKFKIDIETHDLAKITGDDKYGGWLNDNIMDFYLGLITDRAKSAGIKAEYHLCIFYTTLSQSGYNYKKVERWSKRRKFGGSELLKLDYLFIPINQGGNHWTLGVINPKQKRFEFYDSMSNVTPGRLCHQNLRRFMQDETGKDISTWEDFGLGSKAPKQNNASDCGMFALKTAEVIASGAQPGFGPEDIKKLRQWMLLEITKGELLHC